MKTAYFPFTYMDHRTAAVLSALFDGTLVYHPARNMAAAPGTPAPGTLTPDSTNSADAAGGPENPMDIRVPLDADADRLAGTLAAYGEWASMHGGGLMAVFQAMPEKAPFFDENATSRIRSEILRRKAMNPADGPAGKGSAGDGLAGDGSAKAAADPDFEARLFLCVAHEFDRRQQEMEQELRAVDRGADRLMESLHGREPETPVAPLPSLPATDTGIHHTQTRLAAWTRLMVHDPDLNPADTIFITTSRPILDQVMDQALDLAEKMHTMNGTGGGAAFDPLDRLVIHLDPADPGARDRLRAAATEFAGGGKPGEIGARAPGGVAIALHRAAGIPIAALLSGAAPGAQASGKGDKCLFGLVEFVI